MKGKLIKTDKNEYCLYTNDSMLFATTDNSPYKKLSLKNCEVIANGYDLDEIVEQTKQTLEDSRISSYDSFKIGFQKALEILGGKKFSEVNMEDAYYFGSRKFRREYLDFIKTFQQTEWNVSVVMEDCNVEKVYLGKNNSVSSYETPEHRIVAWLKAENISDKQAEMIWNNRLPKYAQDECLILKRI